MKRASILAILLTLGGIGAAQQSGVVEGGKLFATNCSVCHGMDGAGGTAPLDLTRGEFKHGGSDQELFATISKGIPGTEMPGSFLEPAEIKQVVEFVQSLSQTTSGSGPGNPVRGQALFHGKGGCTACHGVTEEGSHAGAIQLGPNLYGIGDRRSREVIQSSLIRMHRGLSEFHWEVTAETKDGKRITGVRLNEDTHSIQLRDSNNNLVSLLKKNLKDFEVKRGDPMPVFDAMLMPTEIADLAAYMSTLQRTSSTR